MKRIRTSLTALLLVAPLTLTACSDGDTDTVGPGDVEAPPVEAPDVEVESEGDGLY